MFSKSKKKTDPEAAKEQTYERRVCMANGASTIKLESLKTRQVYAAPYERYSVGLGGYATVPVQTFGDSLTEAREFVELLTSAIDEASRLEGAVASLYPGK